MSQKYLNKKILVGSFYPTAKNGKQPEYSSAGQMLNNYVMFAPLNTILINARNKQIIDTFNNMDESPDIMSMEHKRVPTTLLDLNEVLRQAI